MTTAATACKNSWDHALVMWMEPRIPAPGFAPLPACWGWVGILAGLLRCEALAIPSMDTRDSAGQDSSLPRSYASGVTRLQKSCEAGPWGEHEVAELAAQSGQGAIEIDRVVACVAAANPPFIIRPKRSKQAGGAMRMHDGMGGRAGKNYSCRCERQGRPLLQKLQSHPCMSLLTQPYKYQPLLAIPAANCHAVSPTHSLSGAGRRRRRL